LNEYCEANRERWGGAGGHREREALLGALAALLEQIAHHRLVLLDFGPDNIFVAEGRGGPQLLLDDLRKVKVAGNAPFRKQLVDAVRVREMFSSILTPDEMEGLLGRLGVVSPGPSGTGVET